jgi:transitional endoplasmic reticulum ATPase
MNPVIALNYALINRLWNQRRQPEIRERIIELYKEIMRETADQKEANRARENIELLRKEALLLSHNEISMDSSDVASEAVQPKNSTLERSSSSKVSGIQSSYLKMENDKDLEASIKNFIVVEKPGIPFSKIGGLEDVKEILKMEVIYPYLHRDLYDIYGREPGCGVLLHGPPGCGKTLLAKAVATECDAVFLAPQIHNIMSRYVGEEEKKVAAIFEYARSFDRASIFFDEIDSLIPRFGPSYVRRLKDEFLQQMDGIFSKQKNILVLGATNRLWLIDPAMRRPGRFSKVILIYPPDKEARKEIFKIHLDKLVSNKMLANDVDLEELASKTHGFSGADIKGVVEAAIDIPLLEAIKGAEPRQVSRQDFLKAISLAKPSIKPWITDAIKAVKIYGEGDLASQIEDLAKMYADL